MKDAIIRSLFALGVIAGATTPCFGEQSANWHEKCLVKRLEKCLADGTGLLWPLSNIPLVHNLGTVFVLDEPFSPEFLDALETIPWEEENGGFVSTIFVWFNDNSGNLNWSLRRTRRDSRRRKKWRRKT